MVIATTTTTTIIIITIIMAIATTTIITIITITMIAATTDLAFNQDGGLSPVVPADRKMTGANLNRWFFCPASQR